MKVKRYPHARSERGRELKFRFLVHTDRRRIAMAAPLGVFLFVLVASVALGQKTAPVKAGDSAPEIDWTRIVHAPESAKYHPGLTGQYTVLQFLRPVTANAQAIDQWNELISKFRYQPVQFVWIASEQWQVIQPFLREHPMDGWLLIDEKNEAA
jgi:hypothetical protein